MKLDEEKIADWLEKIQSVYVHADLDMAATTCDLALEDTERAPQILEAAGLIAYQQNYPREAILLIEEAMFQRVLSFSARLTLAKAYMATQQQDAAKIELSFMIEQVQIFPCSLLSDFTITVAEFGRNDWAMTVCREGCRRHPHDDNAFYGTAFYMYKLGYPLESVQCLVNKALSLRPDSQLYRLTMAVVCTSLKQWETAFSHACKLEDATLKNVPHPSFLKTLHRLFKRYDDSKRLKLLNLASIETERFED